MIRTKSTTATSKPKGKAAAKGKAAPVQAPPAAAPKGPATKAKKKPAPKRRARKVKAKAPPPKASAKPAGEGKPAEQPQKPGPAPKLGAKDVARVIEMLRNMGGIKSAAAEKLNVSRQTLYTFLEDHPEVVEATADIKEELLDVGESRVVMALRAGDMQTVRWYMELQGKDRGYVRRVEQTGKNGGPVETQERANPKDYTDEELEVLIAAAQRRKAAEAQG